MGGSRPMTVGRAVSLGALIAVLLGIATGLSHIGHTSVAKCTGTWHVVLEHPSDEGPTASENTRAVQLVPTLCTGAARDPKGGWKAFAIFDTQQAAQTYAQQLIAAGYAKKWGFQPYVEQAPTTSTPTP